MTQESDSTNPFDPLGAWRTMRDSSMESWSKAMIDLVNSDAYAEATAHMLDSYLSVSTPLQKIVEQTMTQVLAQLNLPSRSDVTNLAERLTNIELRLDDLDAKLDEFQTSLKTPAAPTPRSTRTTKEQ